MGDCCSGEQAATLPVFFPKIKRLIGSFLYLGNAVPRSMIVKCSVGRVKEDLNQIDPLSASERERGHCVALIATSRQAATQQHKQQQQQQQQQQKQLAPPAAGIVSRPI